MYDYIQISKINDFIFCPHSLYFHSVYENFDGKHYKATPQIAGTIAHKTVDTKTSSTSRNILQGMEVFSEQYGIIGKIDLYDTEKNELIERKRMIKQIYDGYVFQLYAQKCCIEEMGYSVEKMTLHSLTDNKKYDVVLTCEQVELFKKTLAAIKNFNPLLSKKCDNVGKCENCIYRELCRKTI